MSETMYQDRDYPRVFPHVYLNDGEINHEAIRYYRVIQGMTQQELADFLGVGRFSVQQWETDNVEPLERNMVKLHHFFELTKRTMMNNGGVVPYHKSLKRLVNDDNVDLNTIMEFIESRTKEE